MLNLADSDFYEFLCICALFLMMVVSCKQCDGPIMQIKIL